MSAHSEVLLISTHNMFLSRKKTPKHLYFSIKNSALSGAMMMQTVTFFITKFLYLYTVIHVGHCYIHVYSFTRF